MDRISEYERARDELAREIKAARQQGCPVRLRKSTSNLFRNRKRSGMCGLDVGRLRHVLGIDRDRMVADVEGMTRYETVVAQTLRHGLLPAVTPELKTITAGGAVSGLAVESSSFQFGLVHETVADMEVLQGDGSVVKCSRDTNADLFYCLPNSYGTLGYILRLTVRLVPAKPFVCLTHTGYQTVEEYFRAIGAAVEDRDIDFLDGTVFGPGQMYLTAARMQDEAPWTSDYTYLRIYYKSIPATSIDYLRTKDYVWRWDTDWFWCSKQFCVQHPLARLIATPWLLNSATYQRVMRFSNRIQPPSSGAESVIQDVAIPVRNAPAFLEFLLSEIPITPIWLCPFRASREAPAYSLYPITPGLYINFGFWDLIPAQSESAYYNKKIERIAQELCGRKGLYSSSFYDAETFRSLYDYERYEALKSKCEPGGLFGDLYAKCVRGA